MGLLACIQMASGPNIQANLQEAGRLLAAAAQAGAQMAVLPENFALMGMQETDKLKAKEAEGKGPMQDFLAETAVKHKLWIVGGTIPLRCEDARRVRTAVLLFDDRGRIVTRYDKIHLFDVELPGSQESYNESTTIEGGDDVVVVDTPLGCLGLAVCYDLRFPEMFRLQLDRGMQLLAVPSAFTALTGKAHWQALLMTRAIENQCYVAAAGQGGYHVNGRETYGHSMIVNPWGVILDCIPQGPGFALAEIDHDKLNAIRQRFPVIQHRRLSCRIVR